MAVPDFSFKQVRGGVPLMNTFIEGKLRSNSVVAAGGLNITVTSSYFISDQFFAPDATNFLLTASSISYVYADSAGALNASTTFPTGTFILLAVVATSGAAVTVIVLSAIGPAAQHVFLAPSAAGTTIIATQTTNFTVTTGITQTDVPRCVQCVFSGTYNGGNIEVLGTDARGHYTIDVVTAAAGTTVQGVVPFASIVQLRNLGTLTAGNVAIQRGTKLGFPHKRIGLVKASAGGANIGFGTVNASNGTVIPAVSPDGSINYMYWYTYFT